MNRRKIHTWCGTKFTIKRDEPTASSTIISFQGGGWPYILGNIMINHKHLSFSVFFEEQNLQQPHTNYGNGECSIEFICSCLRCGLKNNVTTVATSDLGDPSAPVAVDLITPFS